MSAAIPAILAAATLGVVGFLGYRFLRLLGRLLVRIEAIEQELIVSRALNSESNTRCNEVSDPAPVDGNDLGQADKQRLAKSRLNRTGLAQGTRAPEFALREVDTNESVGLQDFLGTAFLMVFSDPACAPCGELWSRLVPFIRENRQTRVLVVSRGDPETVAAKLGQRAGNNMITVVLQGQWEVSRAYATFGLPSGYWIDESGVIASDLATGPESILQLVRKMSEAQAQRELAVDVSQQGETEGRV